MNKNKIVENLIVWSVCALFLLVFIVGPIVAYVAAPCKFVDWMPAKDVPSRCFKVQP